MRKAFTNLSYCLQLIDEFIFKKAEYIQETSGPRLITTAVEIYNLRYGFSTFFSTPGPLYRYNFFLGDPPYSVH